MIYPWGGLLFGGTVNHLGKESLDDNLGATMRKRRHPLPQLPPDYVIVDWKRMLLHHRTNVIPPLSQVEIEKIKRDWYLFYEFFQENGLTTRTLVQSTD